MNNEAGFGCYLCHEIGWLWREVWGWREAVGGWWCGSRQNMDSYRNIPCVTACFSLLHQGFKWKYAVGCSRTILSTPTTTSPQNNIMPSRPWLFSFVHSRVADRPVIDIDTATATEEETMPSPTPGEDAPAASIAANNVINVSGSSGGTTSFNITYHNCTITSSVINNHYGSGVAGKPYPSNSHLLLHTGNTDSDKDGDDNPNPSPTPAKKKVVPKKVCNTDSHGCIISPHPLIQPWVKNITFKLCKEYFECYIHLHNNINAGEEDSSRCREYLGKGEQTRYCFCSRNII